MGNYRNGGKEWQPQGEPEKTLIHDFPDKELGLRLVDLYFEHANPQMPILHRGEFMAKFEDAYAAGHGGRTAREERIIAGFEDIQKFYQEQGRLPALTESTLPQQPRCVFG